MTLWGDGSHHPASRPKLGTLLGFLLAGVIFIAWLLVKRTVRGLFRLTRAGLLGTGRLCKAPPARPERPTAPDRAPVYALDDYRAWRATTRRWTRPRLSVRVEIALWQVWRWECRDAERGRHRYYGVHLHQNLWER